MAFYTLVYVSLGSGAEEFHNGHLHTAAGTDGSNIRFLVAATVNIIVHIVVEPNALVSAQWGRGPHNKGREMNERWKDC